MILGQFIARNRLASRWTKILVQRESHLGARSDTAWPPRETARRAGDLGLNAPSLA